MKKVTIAGAFLGAALSLGLANAQPMQVKQDMKDAGHDTADATKVAAHDTAHGTKKAYHKTKRATKHVAHKVEGKPDAPKNNLQH